MKKLVSIIMIIMLLLPVLPVYGDEGDRVMQIAGCPEQDFATVCRPECTCEYYPDAGLTIQLGGSEDDGSISIFKTDAPGSNFDAEYYFNNVFLNLLESSYGDNLVDPGEYTLYPFGNREMPGRMAMYLKNGAPWMRFCLYDLADDYFVRYEAFCPFDETAMQNTIDDLSDAVRYFQPDATFYYGDTHDETPVENETSAEAPTPAENKEPSSEPDPEPASDFEIIYPEMPEEAEAGPNYKTISCTAQQFSTRCKIYDFVEFKSNLGITCFLDNEGEVVWVRISRLPYDPSFDAETYFADTITPDMQYIYEENEYGEEAFTTFTVEGKTMPGQEYHFTLHDYEYTRRIMFCKTDNDLVRFEAQYTEDTYNSVMYDLDMVVRCYQPDPYYYTDSNSSDTGNTTGTDAGTDVLTPDTKKEETPVSSLQTIDCPELGFCIQADDAYSWDYKEGTGITIYTETEGLIPYVIIYQSEDLLMEPYEYLREQYTPHLEEKYGDDLLSTAEYEAMEIGGKALPVGVYTYNVQGHTINLLRIMDSTGPQTVIYTVKFEDESAEAALNVLDTAIRTFERK